MSLENSWTFYERHIILLNIVLLRSSSVQNVQTVHHWIFGKVRQPKQMKPLRYMTNGRKNEKTKFCRVLTPWFWSLATGQKIQHCNNVY